MAQSGAVARLAYLALPWSPAIGRTLATRQELFPTRPFVASFRVSEHPATEPVGFRTLQGGLPIPIRPTLDRRPSRCRPVPIVGYGRSATCRPVARTTSLRSDRKSTRL